MNFEQLWMDYKVCKTSQEVHADLNFKTIYIDQASADSDQGRVIKTAAKELQEACQSLLDVTPKIEMCSDFNGLVGVYLNISTALTVADGYHIQEQDGSLVLVGANGRGVLYAVFDVIRHLQRAKSLKACFIQENPDNPLRALNHWDNMDGSIERGYSGHSFFFGQENLLVNDRTKMYARLVASTGINATVINNVNVKGVATELISQRYYEKLQALTKVFSDYGIDLFLSLNYAAPLELGDLETADPSDPDVIAWWEAKMTEVYANLPNLGGFIVKADSEGRPGPFSYGRNQAEGANLLARAIKPHGGVIIWRCFVYNCQQDWRDQETDRARAGYDYFADLDGTFLDNVVLQIKNGPMDFQVREPISPLFGGLKKTNQILEVQIAQEYTGQQKHVCYLVPMFKEILDFKTYCEPERDTVADIVSGRTYGNTLCGMATVCNTGDDSNWTGHDLAGINLYGFGRLCFNTSLTAEAIAEEWIQMTFGLNEKVLETLMHILMTSWSTYEKYTSPLGIGWMVQPNHHYGPSVDGYEYSRWGTYHRADHLGLGVDRTPNGTGYTTQYHQKIASLYDTVETCPEALLLFFHRVLYTHNLKSGKTLIQHIYDTHFDGVQEVEDMITGIEALKDRLDERRYKRILERFDKQLESAIEWRDQVNSYFFRKSGIQDEKGRPIY